MSDLDSVVDEIMQEHQEAEKASENQEETEDTGTAETQAEEAAETDEAEADDNQSETEDEAEEHDEGDDESEEADEDASDLISFNYNGEEISVPLDELTRGYSGQRKVTEGMQANSAEREAIKAEKATLAEERQQAATAINGVLQIAQNLQQQGILPPPQMPSPEDFQNDPLGASEAWNKYNHDLVHYQNQQAQMTFLQSQREAMENARLAEVREEQAKILAQRVPEFADEAKRDQLGKELSDYLGGMGITQEMMSRVNDAASIELAIKAMKYDQLQAAQSKVQKKTAKARPALKPGAKKAAQNPQTRKLDAARKRLRESGSLEDAVNLQMLENPV